MPEITTALGLAQAVTTELDELIDKDDGFLDLKTSCQKVTELLSEAVKEPPQRVGDLQVDITEVVQVLEEVKDFVKELLKREKAANTWGVVLCPCENKGRFMKYKTDIGHVITGLEPKLKALKQVNAPISIVGGSSSATTTSSKLQAAYSSSGFKEAAGCGKSFQLCLDGGETVIYEGEPSICSSRANSQVLPGKLIFMCKKEIEVAIKCSEVSNLQDAEAFKAEIDIQKKWPVHPHIVRLYGGKVDLPKFGNNKYRVFVIMERMREDLDGYMKRSHIQKTCTYEDLLNVFISICDGLHFMHEKKVIHYDLKPQNILVSSDGKIKIADFGCSTTLPDGEKSMAKKQRGTRGYMAPELTVPMAEKISDAIDIYSLGVIFWECLNFCSFSETMSNATTSTGEKTGSIVCYGSAGQIKSIHVRGPKHIAKEVEKCLNYTGKCDNSRHCRPTAKELHDRFHIMLSRKPAHPWLQCRVSQYDEEFPNSDGLDNVTEEDLIQAVKEGTIGPVQEILCKTGNRFLGAVDQSGWSLVIIAAAEGFNDIVKILHKHGANIHAFDQYKSWTPLMAAAAYGHVPVVRYLLREGCK